MASREGTPFLELLELLVRSCAEATIISDRGEYEEPPIVMALKANVYAPMLQPEESTSARIERHIFDMVNCMLQYYPQAASKVFKGYRGHYTALHSAVFHGRSPETIELLLDAERRAPSPQKACLLGNTQGELPLHFCAMRGEPPRTVALVRVSFFLVFVGRVYILFRSLFSKVQTENTHLILFFSSLPSLLIVMQLAEAAPEAVSQRDASGLTPLHWLWIRFVSTLLTIDDGRVNSITVPLKKRARESNSSSSTTQQSHNLMFASLKQEDFQADLQLLRRADPSVDFLRMRHIPMEVQEESEALQWADRTAELLKGVRDRLHQKSTSESDGEDVIVLNRLEAVSTLFWTKVVSLLKTMQCARSTENNQPPDSDLVSCLMRTAFENECCPPLVARLLALMHPEDTLSS